MQNPKTIKEKEEIFPYTSNGDTSHTSQYSMQVKIHNLTFTSDIPPFIISYQTSANFCTMIRQIKALLLCVIYYFN